MQICSFSMHSFRVHLLFTFIFSTMRDLQEIEYLKLCKQEIEAHINIGDFANWTQQDYEHLSNLIYEKTKTQLSISTLKRLWIYKTETLPNISTLNALIQFIGYNDWYDFKKKHDIEEDEIATTKPVRRKFMLKWPRKYRIYAAIAVGMVFTIFFFTGNIPTTLNEEDVVFDLKKNKVSGVPNTVVFNYDISKTRFDQAQIQQDWDASRRVFVSSKNKFHSCIYYYPGYFDAKLVVDNKVIKNTPLLIETDGWLPLVTIEKYQEKPIYIDKNVVGANFLYVSPDIIKKSDVDVTTDYYVSFYNVRDFGNVDCENFTLRSEIKNNTNEGGSSCQYSDVVLKFEHGRLLTPFSNIGCTSILNVLYGEKYLKGAENDFSSLGIDLSDWARIEIKSINKQVAVFVEGEKVFELAFDTSLGKLVGLNYQFNGCGAVRNIELLDAGNILVYSDFIANQE